MSPSLLPHISMPDSITADPKQARVVICGAGQAGAETALALRQQGHAGAITLIGDEPHAPYRRPPLSKTCLAGQVALATLLIRPPEAYAGAGIALMLGRRGVAIDRGGATLTLDDGTIVPYDRLVLALGGQARQLALDGAGAANLHYLRGIADADRLRAELAPGRRIVVIGGGYVGLEVAASAARAGARVTVLEAGPQLLARVAEPELSNFFQELHRANGVVIHTGTAVTGLELEHGRVRAVLAGTRRIEADAIVVGIGLLPHTALALAAGLEVADGIVVDEYARSSDPAILAVGDCARHFHPLLGRSVRLESVPSASEMARVAASVIVGAPQAIGALPWFWSDQFDARLQMAGFADGHDKVVLRTLGSAPGGAAFSACYLRDGRLIAVACVNAAQEFQAARELIVRQIALDPARLADPAVALKSLLAAVPA